MAKITDISEYQEHYSGTAVCIGCKQEFANCYPAKDIPPFKCPECGAHKVVWSKFIHPDSGVARYECVCGSQVFGLLEDGFCCACCGRVKSFDETE